MTAEKNRAVAEHPLDGVVRRPDGTTRNAQKKCADWLCFCLDIGWQKDQLDDLENIWWRFHDKDGNLVSPNK